MPYLFLAEKVLGENVYVKCSYTYLVSIVVSVHHTTVFYSIGHGNGSGRWRNITLILTLEAGKRKRDRAEHAEHKHATKGSRSIPPCAIAIKQMTILNLLECRQVMLLVLWKPKILSQGKHVYVQEPVFKWWCFGGLH